LFGISNQMLAGIALILATCVLFKMKRDRYAWITAVPATWLLICTLTAGWQKVFDSNPKVGFLAHASRYQEALADGKLLAPAKSIAEMQRVIFNDRLDAGLAFLFMAVVVSVLVLGIRTIINARKGTRPTAQEAPFEAFPPGTLPQG
jgi:carbon starvation protein